jgi:hypothetical protein
MHTFPCGKNTSRFNIKAGGTYSNHYDLKGLVPAVRKKLPVQTGEETGSEGSEKIV